MELPSHKPIPAGIRTVYDVEDYSNHHACYGRFTTMAEAEACKAAHMSRYRRDPVIRALHIIGRF